MEQNPDERVYSWNLEAVHRTFVKQWEMAQFTVSKENSNFLKYFFWTNNQSKSGHSSPKYLGYNPLLGLLKKSMFKNKFSENFDSVFFNYKGAPL